MSNHHLHRSAGPFTILPFLLFYYFTSIRFQAEVFASRVAKPECRTTIFTGPPAVFASRVAKPECRTTIFTSRPDRLLFYYLYYFVSIRFQAEVFCMSGRQSYTSAAPQHFPEVFWHLGQPFLHVGSRFCMSPKLIPLAVGWFARGPCKHIFAVRNASREFLHGHDSSHLQFADRSTPKKIIWIPASGGSSGRNECCHAQELF